MFNSKYWIVKNLRYVAKRHHSMSTLHEQYRPCSFLKRHQSLSIAEIEELLWSSSPPHFSPSKRIKHFFPSYELAIQCYPRPSRLHGFNYEVLVVDEGHKLKNKVSPAPFGSSGGGLMHCRNKQQSTSSFFVSLFPLLLTQVTQRPPKVGSRRFCGSFPQLPKDHISYPI